MPSENFARRCKKNAGKVDFVVPLACRSRVEAACSMLMKGYFPFFCRRQVARGYLSLSLESYSLLGSNRSDNLVKARVAAERIPKRHQF